MRRFCTAAIIAAALALGVFAPAAFAGQGNPAGTGPPGASCQAYLPDGNTPGHSASSPGSPFNEPGFGSTLGGIGGQNYSENSQYDVACFHLNP